MSFYYHRRGPRVWNRRDVFPVRQLIPYSHPCALDRPSSAAGILGR